MGIDCPDFGEPLLRAQEAVGNAGEEFSLNGDRIFEKEVKADADRALQRVFQGHHTEIAGPGVDLFENSGDVVAGMVGSAVTEVFHAGEIGEGSLRSKESHAQGALQGTGGREDFAPDGLQGFLRKRAGISGRKPPEDFNFALGFENVAFFAGLDASDLEAQARALIQKFKEPVIDGIDAVPNPGQLFLGRRSVSSLSVLVCVHRA